MAGRVSRLALAWAAAAGDEGEASSGDRLIDAAPWIAEQKVGSLAALPAWASEKAGNYWILAWARRPSSICLTCCSCASFCIRGRNSSKLGILRGRLSSSLMTW